MAKVQQDFSQHFKLARNKARELGYSSLLELNQIGSDQHKLLIQLVYRNPLPVDTNNQVSIK